MRHLALMAVLVAACAAEPVWQPVCWPEGTTGVVTYDCPDPDSQGLVYTPPIRVVIEPAYFDAEAAEQLATAAAAEWDAELFEFGATNEEADLGIVLLPYESDPVVVSFVQDGKLRTAVRLDHTKPDLQARLTRALGRALGLTNPNPSARNLSALSSRYEAP